MKFVCDHNIVYKGNLYKGNVPFEIDNADVKMMAKYGEIIDKSDAGVVEVIADKPVEDIAEKPVAMATANNPLATVKKGGRPKKQQ